jgi:hypothetical protein
MPESRTIPNAPCVSQIDSSAAVGSLQPTEPTIIGERTVPCSMKHRSRPEHPESHLDGGASIRKTIMPGLSHTIVASSTLSYLSHHDEIALRDVDVGELSYFPMFASYPLTNDLLPSMTCPGTVRMARPTLPSFFGSDTARLSRGESGIWTCRGMG